MKTLETLRELVEGLLYFSVVVIAGIILIILAPVLRFFSRIKEWFSK